MAWTYVHQREAQQLTIFLKFYSVFHVKYFYLCYLLHKSENLVLYHLTEEKTEDRRIYFTCQR